MGYWVAAGVLSLLLGMALFLNSQDAEGVQAGLGILLFFFGIIDLAVCAIIWIPRMFVRSVLEDETGLLASHLAERRHQEQLAYEEAHTASAIANARARISASAIPSGVIFCDRCDALNIAGAARCVSCHSPLTGDSSINA